MANFLCANCSWQGNSMICPNCGERTESLYVEDYSGLPGANEMEFAAADYQDIEVESFDDEF